MQIKKVIGIFSIILFFTVFLCNSNIKTFAKETESLEEQTAWELQNNEQILESLANVETEQIPHPYWLYTNDCQVTLRILDGGLARCSFGILGKYPLVNRISSYMYLQKKNNGTYATIAGGTWNKMVNDSYNSLECEKQLSSRGTYRVLVVHYVYTTEGNREEVQVSGYEKTY